MLRSEELRAGTTTGTSIRDTVEGRLSMMKSARLQRLGMECCTTDSMAVCKMATSFHVGMVTYYVGVAMN